MGLAKSGGACARAALAWIRAGWARLGIRRAQSLPWRSPRPGPRLWLAARETRRFDGERLIQDGRSLGFLMIFAGSAPPDFKETRRSVFDERFTLSAYGPGWELSRDEGLDHRHALVEMAFASRWAEAVRSPAGPERDLALDQISEQIAERLFGGPSLAPSEEWLKGLFESADAGREIVERSRYKLEARRVGEALAPSAGADGRPRRGSARAL